MATHGEKLMELQAELRGARGQLFGGKGERDALQLQIGGLQHESAFYSDQVQKGLALITRPLDRRHAQTHLGGALAHYQELGQRLRAWRGWLVTEGYLTEQQAQQIEIRIPPYQPLVERNNQAAREGLAMKAAVDAVLAAATDRREALKYFNRIQGSCDERKITSWLRECVTAQCLPEEYLPMRGAGRRILKSLEVK